MAKRLKNYENKIRQRRNKDYYVYFILDRGSRFMSEARYVGVEYDFSEDRVRYLGDEFEFTRSDYRESTKEEKNRALKAFFDLIMDNFANNSIARYAVESAMEMLENNESRS